MSRLKLKRIRTAIPVMVVACVALLPATTAVATIIADVTHLKGRRQNHLMGYGLVVGLSGTGDGDKYAASIRQLQSMLEKFEVPVMQSELKGTKNVAIVWVEVTLPENGVREGDRVDVHVSAVGAAKSLVGGRLVMTPMQDVTRSGLYAWAQGPIRVTNLKQPTTGRISKGAVMEEDFIHHYINDTWEITLVLEDVHASHALAAVIAQTINEDQSEVGQVRRVALAHDPKNVVVMIPEPERLNPAEFIGRIERLELLMPQGEGRIVINRATHTIAIGAGVEIGEAIIAHGGMTIRTTTPPIKPTVENPLVEEKHAVKIGSPRRGGAKLQELVDKLNELNVPAGDIIEIVETLYRARKIRGKLVYTDTTDKE
ncbi:MAG: flagellar basal body P-ring protein FlgI [Phycisphaerae bacterium]